MDIIIHIIHIIFVIVLDEYSIFVILVAQLRLSRSLSLCLSRSIRALIESKLHLWAIHRHGCSCCAPRRSPFVPLGESFLLRSLSLALAILAHFWLECWPSGISSEWRVVVRAIAMPFDKCDGIFFATHTHTHTNAERLSKRIKNFQLAAHLSWMP